MWLWPCCGYGALIWCSHNHCIIGTWQAIPVRPTFSACCLHASLHVLLLLTVRTCSCGVCLDTWMYPLYEEIYHQVDRPTIFINTWHFHWPDNIMRMQKLMRKIQETGMYSACMHGVRCDAKRDVTEIAEMPIRTALALHCTYVYNVSIVSLCWSWLLTMQQILSTPLTVHIWLYSTVRLSYCSYCKWLWRQCAHVQWDGVEAELDWWIEILDRIKLHVRSPRLLVRAPMATSYSNIRTRVTRGLHAITWLQGHASLGGVDVCLCVMRMTLKSWSCLQAATARCSQFGMLHISCTSTTWVTCMCGMQIPSVTMYSPLSSV